MRRVYRRAEPKVPVTPGCGLRRTSKDRLPQEHSQDKGSIDFALDLMEYAEVAIAPGRAFGERGEDYMRIALVENEQRLRQAVRNISRFVRRGQPENNKTQ